MIHSAIAIFILSLIISNYHKYRLIATSKKHECSDLKTMKSWEALAKKVGNSVYYSGCLLIIFTAALYTSGLYIAYYYLKLLILSL